VNVDAKILLVAFGGTKQILGTTTLEFPLEAPSTVADLFDRICRDYPALARHQCSIRLAVNGSYAQAGDPVSPGDEVALIPPVAGG
jgi:molybdopterin converting factor small subunit